MLQKAPFALLALLQSLIRRLLLRCISTAYVGGPRNCYWGVLFLKGQRVNGSTGQTGQRVTFTFTILYMIADDARLTPPRCKKHTGSTGRRVNGSNGSTGQWVTFTFTILYMIADNARLTPPRCKNHTAYDDTRLTPHCCKKHTASFARSTGKFPSIYNTGPAMFNYFSKCGFSAIGACAKTCNNTVLIAAQWTEVSWNEYSLRNTSTDVQHGKLNPRARDLESNALLAASIMLLPSIRPCLFSLFSFPLAVFLKPFTTIGVMDQFYISLLIWKL